MEENAFLDFPEAADNVGKAMSRWKEEYDTISAKSPSASSTDISSSLTTAIDQLPQMTERKKKCEMHVQIATRIFSEIKRRSIDKLQDFEDELMTAGKLSAASKVEVIALFKRETDKQEEYMDKLRLLLIYIFCGNDIAEIK